VTSGRQPTTAAGVDRDGESPPHSTPEEPNICGFVGNDSINYLDDSGFRIRRFPRVEPPPRPPRTDPREPPMEDWPGPTVDQWNDWLLRHIDAHARRLCAKKQRPSIMGCRCCVVSVCWNEGIVTGTVSMYATYAYVSGNSCSEVRNSFRRHGTIGAACPKRWNSDTIFIPW